MNGENRVPDRISNVTTDRITLQGFVGVSGRSIRVPGSGRDRVTPQTAMIARSFHTKAAFD